MNRSLALILVFLPNIQGGVFREQRPQFGCDRFVCDKQTNRETVAGDRIVSHADMSSKSSELHKFVVRRVLARRQIEQKQRSFAKHTSALPPQPQSLR